MQRQQAFTTQRLAENQVVHVRENSESELEALFLAAFKPPSHAASHGVPMRSRPGLPASFFQEPRSKSNLIALKPQHNKTMSSPASLQETLAFGRQLGQQQQQQSHVRGRSFDVLQEEPLPHGFEAAMTPDGRVYYIDHINKTTTWDDPRRQQQQQLEPPSPQQRRLLTSVDELALPEGWERGVTDQGEVYYINHSAKTTQWHHPALSQPATQHYRIQFRQVQPPPSQPQPLRPEPQNEGRSSSMNFLQQLMTSAQQRSNLGQPERDDITEGPTGTELPPPEPVPVAPSAVTPHMNQTHGGQQTVAWI